MPLEKIKLNYYFLKRKKVLTPAIMLMNLEDTVQNEISQLQKDELYDSTHNRQLGRQIC